VNISLVVLAFNEKDFIKHVVEKYEKKFYEIIIVDDNSTDGTTEILENLALKTSNLNLIKNKKNIGAGKSLFKGIDYFLKTESDYLIKIDGDDQFIKEDVDFLIEKIKKEHFDFIKCDRFWTQGIIGKIPNIRYFGNAFASFLIKFTSGNWQINDPLNGLFLFSKNAVFNLDLPKLFNRYGYPFYLTAEIAKKSINSDLKIGQYKNKVKYDDEQSTLNPITMFFKLTWYTIKNYYSKIILKLKISELQSSAMLDLFGQIMFGASAFSVSRFFLIRYTELQGPQGIWFLVFLILFFVFIFVAVISQKIESSVAKGKFVKLN
tara:strand:- start:902 stop:1861 length:960 start_codon:yes stop_codon:yes gene_type:complete